MKSFSVGRAALFAGLLLGSISTATTTAMAQAAPATVDARARAEGQELFRRATRDYDAGRYAAATALFRAAFETDRSSPAYLFNAARAAEMANEHTQAISLYEWILRELPASDTDAREGAQSALNRLNAGRDAERRQLAEAQRLRDLEAQRQQRTLQPQLPPPPPPSRFTAGPFVTLGAGAVLMGSAGIFFALREANLSRCNRDVHPIECPNDAADGAASMNLLSNVFLVGGGVVVAAGGVWFIVQAVSSPAAPAPSNNASAPRAQLVPTLNGAALVGTW
jgi:tetratricopeptide (TPR) repeat protein